MNELFFLNSVSSSSSSSNSPYSTDTNNSFQTSISPYIKGKVIINLNMFQLYNTHNFRTLLDQVRQGLFIVYIKLVFRNNDVKMAGSQMVIDFKEDSSGEEFRFTVIDQISSVLDRYVVNSSEINHIIITFIPVNVNYINKFKSVVSSDVSLNKFITDSFVKKTILPVLMDNDFLGRELDKVVYNGKILDVMFSVNGIKHSLANMFRLNKKLSNLNENFKFHLVMLNKRHYIIALYYFSNVKVRKIRLNTVGTILEDVIDHKLHDGSNKRVVGDNVIIINNNNLVISAYKDYVLPPVKVPSYNDNYYTENPNIGVIDLETFLCKDNTYKVYAAGLKTYLDSKVIMFYIEENLDSNKVVLNLINELLRSRYSKTSFYCHNLGGFDVIFIIKVLIDYNMNNEDGYKLSYKFRDNTILSITRGSNKVTIQDSYAIFTYSLRKLAIAYECDILKGNFPYKFSNYNNLFYIGVTPDITYYDNMVVSEYSNKSEYIILDDYNKMFSTNWNFKDETLKYLKSDLESLYLVLAKANQSLMLTYGVDMTKSLSISGVALNLFLTKHYNNNIPLIIQKSMYSDIKLGYYGGITEVYRPYGTNLFYYDINSLYPYAALNSMPGLECRKLFSMDNTNLDDLFGFFYCVIDTSNVTEQYLGLLPFRGAISGLVFPLGKWEGWYFSEELKFASQHGYVINVIKGYQFSRVNSVFDSYINKVYHNKLHSTNSTSRNISKSLLNNLLGRFGINLNKYQTKILNNSDFENILHVRDVKGHSRIGDMNLVSYSTGLNYNLIDSLGMDLSSVLREHSDSEINPQNSSSVAISAAVTAYARVIMCKHKLDILSRGGKIYYSDTDSIVTDMELPSELVHKNELGKFKLEHKVKEGIFISGKTYCLVTEDGKLIKRAKGVKTDSLSYNDYINLLNNTNVSVIKKSSIKDYTKGSVEIMTLNVMLNADVYSKRTKLYQGSILTNTKPIYINEIDKSLIVYKKPCLSLVVIEVITHKVMLGIIDTNINKNMDQTSTYTLFYNGLVVYPLFGFFIVLYLLGKGLSEEYMEGDVTDDFNITTPNITSIADLNRNHYINSERFIKSKNQDGSKILSSLPDNVDFSQNSSSTMNDSSRPTTVSPDSSRPTTSYSTNTTLSATTNSSLDTNLVSPDLSKDLFTPTTYSELDKEISKNSTNINLLDKTISDEGIRNSILEKLMEEREYLLRQKANHLAASLQLGKNTQLCEVDSDMLHKDIASLKKRTDSLYNKSINNYNRLEVVKEEDNK